MLYIIYYQASQKITLSHTCKLAHIRKKNQNNQCWSERKKKILISSEKVDLSILLDNNMNIVKKCRIEITFDPTIPLIGIHPKGPKDFLRKDICTSMCIAALFTVAKTIFRFFNPSSYTDCSLCWLNSTTLKCLTSLGLVQEREMGVTGLRRPHTSYSLNFLLTVTLDFSNP